MVLVSVIMISHVLFFPLKIVSYLLDLPEKDEEEVERAQINNFDTLWGETGKNSYVALGSIKNTLNTENQL